MNPELDWADLQTKFEHLADLINKFGQTLTEALKLTAPTIEKLYEAMYQDEPMPGEEPVDFVMRVGARSGFFIYPDEAWRYRANLDWWNERNQDKRGG